MRIAGCVALVCALALPLQAPAQEDTVLRKWDFDKDIEGWITVDDQATLTRTTAADARFKGEGALEFSFPQRIPDPANPDAIPGVAIAQIEGGVKGLKSIRFAISVAFSGPAFVVLNEADGSNYMAAVWVQAGHWNECELGLEDFSMDEDKPDDNGQLDPEQINALAFGDLTFLPRMMAGQGMPIHVPPAEKMSIWLDEVILSSAEATKPGGDGPADPTRVLLDDCQGPTIKYLALGGEDVEMSIVKPEGQTEGHLEIKYVTPPGTIFAVARPVGPGALAGCKGLTSGMRSELATQLIVVVEEASKGRYYIPLELAGSKEWQTLNGAFKDFVLTDDSTDPNGRLDPDQIVRVILVDPTAMMQGTIAANTLSLRDLAATR